jgi:hypothetical protein
MAALTGATCAQRLTASKIGSPLASEVIGRQYLIVPPFKHRPVCVEKRESWDFIAVRTSHMAANFPAHSTASSIA